MKTSFLVLTSLLFGSLLADAIVTPVHAEPQTQIPTLQVCNTTQVSGAGTVQITTRGTFQIELKLSCPDSETGYPAGALVISAINLNDSAIPIDTTIISTNIEQVTTAGRATPTVYLNGRCEAKQRQEAVIRGCRFWMMIADNRKPDTRDTPDIVSFLVFDQSGNRVTYGTGPLVRGDIRVAPQP